MSTNQNDPPTPDAEDQPGEQYGTTWALSRTGDIDTGKYGRVIPKHDVAAVVQHAKVTLLTPQGTHPFLPEYGLDIFQAIGTSDEELKLAIRDAIGPDAVGMERVQSIPQIVLDREGQNRNNVNAEISMTLVDGRYTDFPFAVREENYQ